MRERFEGEEGKRLLVEALQKQDIVQQDAALANDLAVTGELAVFPPSTDIVLQGSADNSVYLILSGEANVSVNDRFIAARLEGTCIGEMSAIDAAAPRSATVRAKSEVVALKVSESKFRAALDAHPKAYHFLCQLLARRLRQRSHFYQPPNAKPVLFIGCSTEALPIANELQAGFKHDAIEALVWPNGVFGPSGTAIGSFFQLANAADFAAFVISPDDTVISRDSAKQDAPRDNVIFELGLFMGRLDPKRVFLVKEHQADVKIPTDLLGLTPVTFVLKSRDNLAAAVGPVCNELRKVIFSLGVR